MIVSGSKIRLQQIGPCPGGFPYQIQAGDTLFALAGRFNTTVEAIVAANPGIDPENLQIGQTICIPRAGGPPRPCPGGRIYVIQAGDTLYSLAQRFNTTVEAIMRANPDRPDNLQIGQRICIGCATVPGPCPGGRIYVIRAGDLCFRWRNASTPQWRRLCEPTPGSTRQPANRAAHLHPGVPPGPGPCPGGRIYVINRATPVFAGATFQYSGSDCAGQPGIDPDNLQIGQRICIPGAGPPVPCPGGRIYVIQSGDTLYSLAQRFNTTVGDYAGQPGIDPDNLQIGQRICIPA